MYHRAADTHNGHILKCDLDQEKPEVGMRNTLCEILYGEFVGWKNEWQFTKI